MSTQHTNPNRVPAGVRTGGQFTTGARSEAPVILLPSDHTQVNVLGSPPQHESTRTIIQALQDTPGLGDVNVEVRKDSSRAAVTARIHGHDVRVSQYDEDTYRVWDTGSTARDDVLISEGAFRDTLGDRVRDTRESAINQAALDDTYLENAGGPHQYDPVAFFRDRDVPGRDGQPSEHLAFMVRAERMTVGYDDDGQLRVRKGRESFDKLTPRQVANRTNALLDAIGPDRAGAEAYVRTMLEGASQRAANARRGDPILGG